jgi:predicted nucleic acid-binding protein
MTSIKPVKEWKYVFLDTSVIIDYLGNPQRHTKNIDIQERIQKTQELFDKILRTQQGIVLYISAISIAELTKFSSPENVVREIINTFYSFDVTLIDFTTDIANNLQKNLEKYLPEGQKHQFNKKLEQLKNQEGTMSAREWIADDLKIVACAKSRSKLDVVLTADTKSFLPYAQKFELPCLPIQHLETNLLGEIETSKIIQF